MTFMMTSLTYDKSDICQFFIKTYSVLSIQYMYKISCKMYKNFLRYSIFFHRVSTSPSPLQPRDFQKSPAQVGLRQSTFMLFQNIQEENDGVIDFGDTQTDEYESYSVMFLSLLKIFLLIMSWYEKIALVSSIIIFS